ncbi:MAG: ABA4-like family protein [Hyphomicrobiaceae bacterium]
MTPEGLFGIANLVAIAGWILLAAGIIARSGVLRDMIAGLAIPAVLAVGYTALIAVHWSSAKGGFSSLAGVTALFQSPWILLAGWVHYLAFDLFVGAWIARDAETRGLPRLLLLPVLPAVFLFGPAGFLLWLGLRTAVRPVPVSA